VVSNLRFSTEDRLFLEHGIEGLLEISVDDGRWSELSGLARRQQTIELLELLRGDSVTNVFSESRYPDRETFDKCLGNLAAERFTMVVRLKAEASSRRLALVAPSVEKGLAEPDGSRQLKSGSRVVGWTVPFAFGDKSPVMVMDQSSADAFSREWAALRRRLRNDAAKLDNRDEYVARRLERELPDFVNSVKVEITTPPPEEKPRNDSSRKRDKKPRPSMKGSNSDIRTMGGPRTVR